MRINQNLERSSTLVSKLSLYHVSKLTPKSVSPSWQRDNDSLQSKSNRSPPSIFPPPSSQSGHGPESDHLQEESLKREGERERESRLSAYVSAILIVHSSKFFGVTFSFKHELSPSEFDPFLEEDVCQEETRYSRR